MTLHSKIIDNDRAAFFVYNQKQVLQYKGTLASSSYCSNCFVYAKGGATSGKERLLIYNGLIGLSSIDSIRLSF